MEFTIMNLNEGIVSGTLGYDLPTNLTYDLAGDLDIGGGSDSGPITQPPAVIAIFTAANTAITADSTTFTADQTEL